MTFSARKVAILLILVIVAGCRSHYGGGVPVDPDYPGNDMWDGHGPYRSPMRGGDVLH